MAEDYEVEVCPLCDAFVEDGYSVERVFHVHRFNKHTKKETKEKEER